MMMMIMIIMVRKLNKNVNVRTCPLRKESWRYDKNSKDEDTGPNE